MNRILVCGSLNIDYVYRVPHFVRAGETLSSLSRSVFAGGKGLNQAAAVSRAGGDVYFAGAIGQSDGKILLEALKDSAVHTDFVRERSDEVSGHTFIQVEEGSGQNCILLYGGANRSLREEEIEEVLSHFTAGDFLLLQNEINNTDFIIEKAAARGLKICINASPADEIMLNAPLKLCSLIVINETEGAFLSGLEESTDPAEILKALSEKYPASDLLLTLGVRGSMFKKAGESELICCGTYKVRPVDTTAAGDTFFGYFVHSLAIGLKAAEALQRAAAASAIAVTRQGAAPSVPFTEETEAFVKEHKIADPEF